MNKTTKDFFISYSSLDRDWAKWIAWHLEDAGYTTVFAEWDFQPGNNFVHEMQRAAQRCERILAILSPHFLESIYCQPEWQQAFARDPTGEKALIVPVRIAECEMTGFFHPLIYIDFFTECERVQDLSDDEQTARLRAMLLKGVERRALRPSAPPPLPPRQQSTEPFSVDGKGKAHPPNSLTRNPEREDELKVFCHQVVDDYSELDIAFLPRVKSKGLRFHVAEIFIPLRVRSRDLNPGTPDNMGLETQLRDYHNHTEAYEFNFLMERFFDLPQQCLVVLGKPGSGKSTMLRKIAHAFAARLHLRWLAESRAPFLLRAKDIAELLRNQPLDLPAVLQRTFGLSEALIHQLLAAPKEQPQALILFDAIDEVANTHERDGLMDWLHQQTNRYRQIKFILTSRIHGFYTQYAPPSFLAFVTDEFNEQEQREFLLRWFNHIQTGVETNPFSTTPALQADTVAGELAEVIKANDELKTLAANPLMLSMLAVLRWERWQQQSETPLPRRRSDIYRECFGLFTNEVQQHTWDYAKGLGAKPEGATDVLRAAAWVLQTQRTQVAPGENTTEDSDQPMAMEAMAATELRQLTLATLQRLSPEQVWGAEQITEVFQFSHERTPLLVEISHGHWLFLHQTLQEFLAAEVLLHWVERGNSEPLAEFVANHWGQSYWRLSWELLLEMLTVKQHGQSVQHYLLPVLRQQIEQTPETFVAGADWGKPGWFLSLWQRRELWSDVERGAIERLAWQQITSPDHRLWHHCHRLLTNEESTAINSDTWLASAREHEGDVTGHARLLLLGAELFVNCIDSEREKLANYFHQQLSSAASIAIGATAALALDYWRHAEAGITADYLLVAIPASSFYRGTFQNDEISWANSDDDYSGPYALEAYDLSCFPVTNYQYRRYLQAVGKDEGEYCAKPFDPAVYVSHYEAQAYCAWLSDQTGDEWQLPSEAQWERAARGPAKFNGNLNHRLWPWGGYENGRCNNEELEIYATSAVGAFPLGESPDGLQDLCGNVWEWCADKYDSAYYEQQSAAINTKGDFQVVRGGAFDLNRANSSCVCRYSLHPIYCGSDVGFRVARIRKS